jgi:hypothetical protein
MELTTDLAGMAASARAAPSLSAAPGGNTRKTAEDFASFFFSQSFESMFSEMSPDNLFGAGQSETVYRSLMLQEYGKAMAKSDRLGMVDAVQREILRLQEVQP